MAADMSWRDRIQPASFKGVPFAVSGDDKEAGRRTVVHEFPQREDVYVEDLGAATNRFTVQAFVLGSDYMDKRDALERVLNEPGPGTLVHPWYGEITVSQTAPYKVRHSAEDGGMAVFTLSFARDGAPASPAAAVNAQSRALDKADAAEDSACGAFATAFSTLQGYAKEAAQIYQAVAAVYSRVQGILGGDIGALAGFLSDLTGLDLTSVALLGKKIWGFFAQSGSGQDSAAMATSWLKAAAMDIPAVPPLDGSSRALTAAGEAATAIFCRHIAIVEAARALSVIVPSSRAEAAELRDNFVDALDRILREDGGDNASTPAGLAMPDDLYAALVDLRAATLSAMAEAAAGAPDVIAYTPTAVLPSLALCYCLTGTIALDADLVARNQIAHPGFVPVQPLEVLTYG